jgi:uncharacterized integral membrane protein
MKTLSFVIILVIVLLGVFVAANWSVLVQNTPLSFVAFQVEGPLGIIMLGITLVVVALVVIYALILRANWLVESHRLNREVQKQRDLAEQAEISRVTELRSLVEQEFAAMRAAVKEAADHTVSRTDSAEQSVSRTVNEAINSLNAHIGYFDDKLSRVLPLEKPGQDKPAED